MLVPTVRVGDVVGEVFNSSVGRRSRGCQGFAVFLKRALVQISVRRSLKHGWFSWGQIVISAAELASEEFYALEMATFDADAELLYVVLQKPSLYRGAWPAV